jgi:nucleolar pre-ribosomal-associated protein 1
MGKRSVFEANGKAAHAGRQPKRQRTETSHERESPVAGPVAEDEITSARQLEKALVFDQGSASSLRGGK